LLMSWGEPGTGEGEFNIVHNICCDADGWVYVADRENHRVQVFDGNGKFETQWQNLHRPCGLCMPCGQQPIFYVGEVGPAAAVSRDIPNLGPRVSIVDHQGKLIGRFGDTPAGTELGKFLAPHGLAVDSRGDIYVGEVSWTAWPQIYPGKPHPANLRSLQKFEKVEGSFHVTVGVLLSNVRQELCRPPAWSPPCGRFLPASIRQPRAKNPARVMSSSARRPLLSRLCW